MAAREFLFTSESVTEGHPDKVADQISDSVLDAVLSEDPEGRVACETLITTGLVVVAGEISTEIYVDIPKLVRELRLLERRTSRTGKDCVDHGVGGSDDYANVLFGAMRMTTKRKPRDHRPVIVESASGYDLKRGLYNGGQYCGGRY